jgi:hypothetical protein
MPAYHSETAIDILTRTSDGDDLAPTRSEVARKRRQRTPHRKGKIAFADLNKRVVNGYVRLWFRGVEHVTIDHEGYIYWRGNHVEHYCIRLMTAERQQSETEGLARRCLIVEGRGLAVSSTNLIWHWIEPLQPQAS